MRACPRSGQAHVQYGARPTGLALARLRRRRHLRVLAYWRHVGLIAVLRTQRAAPEQASQREEPKATRAHRTLLHRELRARCSVCAARRSCRRSRMHDSACVACHASTVYRCEPIWAHIDIPYSRSCDAPATAARRPSSTTWCTAWSVCSFLATSGCERSELSNGLFVYIYLSKDLRLRLSPDASD